MSFKGCRIILLCGWYYPDSLGGTEVYVHTLGKELKAQGFNVVVVAPSNDEEEHSYIHGGLEVYRYPVSLKPTKSEARINTKPQYFEIFTNWLSNNRPDIVHIHSVTRGCSFFHAQYVRELGIPLIFTAHLPELTCARGSLMRWGRIPCDGHVRPYRCASCYLHKRGLPIPVALAITVVGPFLRELFGKMSNRLTTVLEMKKVIIDRTKTFKNLCVLPDRIVVVSQWLYDVFCLNGVPQGKLYLCRHGLELEKFVKSKVLSNRGTSKVLRVCYVGRFSPIKGVHILIEAIKRLSQSIPIELRLYGRADKEEDQIYFRRLQKIAGGDKRILFGGEVTDENRREIFSNIDVVAVPSLWFETGPLVVLEAFAFGIPVIGSNFGGITELVTDGVNGILVEVGNIKAWRNTLRKLSLNPELVGNLARGVPTTIPSSREIALKMIRFYESVLNLET